MHTQIQMYHDLGLISLAIGGICLAVAAVLFVRFKIHRVVSLFWGRGKKREIRKSDHPDECTRMIDRNDRALFLLLLAGCVGCTGGLVVRAKEVPALQIISVENDAGIPAVDEQGNWYFDKSLSVEIGLEEPATDSLTLLRNGEPVGYLMPGETGFQDCIEDAGEYWYEIVDGEGGILGKKTRIHTVQSSERPILELGLGEHVHERDGGWYGNDEPSWAGDLTASIGIVKLEYRVGDGAYESRMDCRSDGVYRADRYTTGEIPLGEWLDTELGEDGKYDFYIRATNAVGRVCETKVSFWLDRTAPVVSGCLIDGTEAAECDRGILYRNVEGDDVRGTVVITEHPETWDRENTKIFVENIDTGNVIWWKNGSEITWSEDEARHTATFGFDGEDGAEAGYQVFVETQDYAGNRVVEAGTPFFLDHRAPELHVSYEGATRTLCDGLDVTEPELPDPDSCISYYKDGIRCIVAVEDSYGLLRAETLQGFRFWVKKDEEDVENFNFSWEKGETGFTGILDIPVGREAGERDGAYRIELQYEDFAGNQASGTRYRSPLLVLDTVAPVLAVSYEREPKSRTDSWNCFGEPTTLSINVQDSNVRMKELKSELRRLTMTDRCGNPIPGEWPEMGILSGLDETLIKDDVLEVHLPLSTEANYQIPIVCEDLAGNVGDLGMECVVIDETSPTFAWKGKTEQGEDAIDTAYREHGVWFTKEPLTVTIEMEDQTSGVQAAQVVVTSEEGVETKYEKGWNLHESGAFEWLLPDVGTDFKGTLEVWIWDWCGNLATGAKECMVESGDKHEKCGEARIVTETSPSRTVDGVDYYNTDIAFTFVCEDSYSGIREYELAAGSRILEQKVIEAEPGGEITWKVEKDGILDAVSNNQNQVQVTGNFRDNAGHTTSVEQRYHIDITVPVITVTFDRNDAANGMYYREGRTATVKIRERNFREEDVVFDITGTQGGFPKIGSFVTSGSGDDTTHTCQVVFDEDGKYTFSVRFRDLAGNQAVYDEESVFVIDRTAPELTVRFDNENAQNGSYYKEPRKAELIIRERNFDPERMEVEVVSESGSPTPEVSGWTSAEDLHVARILFESDGWYQFTVKGADLADHALIPYESTRFAIDRTPPTIRIHGVEDQSANRGEVILQAETTDENLNGFRTKVALSGVHHGIVEQAGTTNRSTGRVEIALEDFAHTPDMDDLYTGVVTAEDLAGNRSKKEVRFSVNRYGSVYSFSEDTEALVGIHGAYYTREAIDLVLTETNVDELKEYRIVVNQNGQLKDLKEGIDYVVQKQGSKETWKQYTYRVFKENFREEGVYHVTFYSEDLAKNVSDNLSKQKEVAFAVDRTPPEILITGIEEGGRYRQRKREVTIELADNVKLSGARLEVGDTESIYSEEELQASAGRLVLNMSSSNQWQSLHVSAWDAVGNSVDSQEIRFLVTPNRIVQLARNPGLLSAVLLSLFLGGIAVAAVIRMWKIKENSGKSDRKI